MKLDLRKAKVGRQFMFLEFAMVSVEIAKREAQRDLESLNKRLRPKGMVARMVGQPEYLADEPWLRFTGEIEKL